MKMIIGFDWNSKGSPLKRGSTWEVITPAALISEDCIPFTRTGHLAIASLYAYTTPTAVGSDDVEGTLITMSFFLRFRIFDKTSIWKYNGLGIPTIVPVEHVPWYHGTWYHHVHHFWLVIFFSWHVCDFKKSFDTDIDIDIGFQNPEMKFSTLLCLSLAPNAAALLATKKSNVSPNRNSCKISSIPTSLNVAKAIAFRGGAIAHRLLTDSADISSNQGPLWILPQQLLHLLVLLLPTVIFRKVV